MREKRIDTRVQQDLREYGFFNIKTHGSTFSVNGNPDIIVNANGRFLAIEDKAGNGHPLTMAQLYNGYQIVRSNGLWCIAFPDYTTLKKVPRKKLDFDLNVPLLTKINLLSREQYGLLENLYKQINHDKKSLLLLP